MSPQHTDTNKSPTTPIIDLIVDSNNDNDPDDSSTSESLKSVSTSGHKKRQQKRNEIDKEDEEEAILLASRESRQLCWTRGIVMVAMILATFLVAVVIFYSTRQSELEQFETQFGDHSTKIMTAVEDHLREGISALDNLGIAITSYGKSSASVSASSSSGATTSAWPFAVLPDFEVRAASTRNWANAGFLAFLPAVQESQRQEWEQFTRDSTTEWMDASIVYEEELESSSSYSSSLASAAVPADNDPSGRRMATTSVPIEFSSSSSGIAEAIYKMKDDQPVVDEGPGPYYPIWQHSPVQSELVNFNMVSHPQFHEEVRLAIDSQQIVVGRAAEHKKGMAFDRTDNRMERVNQPQSSLFVPVFSDYNTKEDQRDLVGLLTASIDWSVYLKNGDLPPTATGIQCILASSCGEAFTFEVQDNGDLSFIGEGDQHEEGFDELEQMFDLLADLVEHNNDKDHHNYHSLSYNGVTINEDYCSFSLHAFPTKAMQGQYFTNKPTIYTSLVVIVFMFTSIAFFSYDMLVERRQRVVMSTAKKSHKIVANLFPAMVRNRLLGGAGSQGERSGVDSENEKNGTGVTGGSGATMMAPKMRIKSFFDDGGASSHSNGNDISSKPIADLYTDCTVLFADIAGFTAWSSVREPSQVFVLLETVYAAFDRIADRRRVFKVETIGDCYMAVTGLPEKQPDHAVIMAKFAADCVRKMNDITRSLEVTLGVDTAELAIRIGLHSGPVTGGVLRGQKSRFQLFGDTVNTASRMESTGQRRQVQCSQTTGDLLMASGKNSWLVAREDKVQAKGKGVMQTYWVRVTRTNLSRASSVSHSSEPNDNSNGDEQSVTSSGFLDDDDKSYTETDSPDKHRRDSYTSPRASELSPHSQRLVECFVEILSTSLKSVVAHRSSTNYKSALPKLASGLGNIGSMLGNLVPNRDDSASQPVVEGSFSKVGESFSKIISNPREEYAESIQLPRFNSNSVERKVDPETVELPTVVVRQLRDYVTTIALAYPENKFHNFEHASHVTMSANKILKRVVAADECEVHKRASLNHNVTKMFSEMHDYTFGITSDPLTHFSCVFSAMIHDVDHPGVSNFQLASEKDEMALLYQNKSVAEQNSIDYAWGLLMDKSYDDLRQCIFADPSELKRFRMLLVNSVMATDVFDPDLKALRDSRWAKAFAPSSTGEEDDEAAIDLKATIVIEHIIQAADVAHTMQHWHVYQKWNRRLFEEMYTAYKSGRSGGKNPADGWYKGELWFYDNYIIPLAKKLKDCGVFGVASDEFLTYAVDNRREWEQKGIAIVADMVESCTTTTGLSPAE